MRNSESNENSDNGKAARTVTSIKVTTK